MLRNQGHPLALAQHHPHLAAHLGDGRPRLSLPESKGGLLWDVARLLHGTITPFLGVPSSHKTRTSAGPVFGEQITPFWHSRDHAQEAAEARCLGGLRRRKEKITEGACMMLA